MAFPLKSGVSQASGNAWQAQEFIVEEVGGNYPNALKFEVYGDKVASFALQQGEVVTVYLDSKIREYNGNFYNQLRAYKVERVVQQQQAPQQAQYTQSQQAPYAQPQQAPQQAPYAQPQQVQYAPSQQQFPPQQPPVNYQQTYNLPGAQVQPTQPFPPRPDDNGLPF